MITFPGYKIIEKLYEDANTIVYRGQREEPVIIKILKKEHPTPRDIAQLKHEYEISKNLNLDGVVKSYRLEKFNNQLALILEDFNGESLKDILSSQKLDLITFLRLAIQLAEVLGELHQNHIIHKNIKPGNIVVNLKTGQVKISDFGISSLLSQENPNLTNPSKLEGTLAYMSPEQTGRMNRSLDYRSDFYSLGATFYEMLTGRPPFEATDPMELVHCHIAKLPVRPQELNPEIPNAVSDIVMKLMSKTAEERYQSALGLKSDLEECLIQWRTTKKIENFIPGQKDVADKFQIPQKLYGREKEISILLAAFDRVSQGRSEMMLVAGYSGIGKSALVNEIHKPIVRQRGYFISGKFDQFKRNIPYASLIQAFQELMRQLLTESEDRLKIWKDKLLNALGSNGQIVIEVIPEVELIIGKQPEVQALPPTESQNRFNLVFQNFVRLFTQPEHPLVIFLDDLQWADSATLKLIQLLVTDPDGEYLLLIGAYRSNEVNPTHPLIQCLEDIQKSGVSANNIALAPLDIANVNQLIAETLHCEIEKSKSLAMLVQGKTNGNPFFINQFMMTLYHEKLLTFDLNKGEWNWNLDEIRRLDITDNVVEFMANKLQKLPPNTQDVLKLASCIGNRFDLKTLSIVYEKSQPQTMADLWETIREGLILPLDDSYKFLHGPHGYETSDSDAVKIPYKFSHDRVQQAAYSLIPEEHKKEVHLKVGRLMLRNADNLEIEEKIFDIVNQMNAGAELITSEPERGELARLNLIAGQKAKASMAYEPALKYLRVGMDLLGKDSWQSGSSYKLTSELHMERGECEYLSGNFDEAEKYFDAIIKHAHTPLDKAKVYKTRLLLYFHIGKPDKALDMALQGLKLVGVNLPANPSKLRVLNEFLKTRWKLRGKKIEDLAHLPNMTAQRPQIAMDLLMNSMLAAYQASEELFTLLVLRMINITLEFGNTDSSAYAYGVYGVILGSGFGDYKSGYKFGKLAFEVSDKFNNTLLKGRCNHIMATAISHWMRHAAENVPLLKMNIQQYSIESGDLLYLTFARYFIITTHLVTGEPLDLIFKETEDYMVSARRVKYEVDAAIPIQRLILSLKGLTHSLSSFSDSNNSSNNFDEFEFMAHLRQAKNMNNIMTYQILKMQLLYLSENYEAALKLAIESARDLHGVLGQIVLPEYYFYYSLTLAALGASATFKAKAKRKYRRILKRNQKKLKKWADNCPENFLHKYRLVAAEMARSSGQDLKAIALYDKAINAVRENEYVQNEALANELAAKFYLAKGLEKIAKNYMQEAHYGYLRWGATAKAKALEEKYPTLLSPASDTRSARVDEVKISVSPSGSELGALDLATVMKASQAISNEIVLENLLKRMMKILIESAGAQKGYLILENEAGQLFIEAEGAVDKDEVIALQSIPLESSQELDLSVAIVNYVKRTEEIVVLNDAVNEGHFTSEPYVMQRQPKSILCMPIIKQRKRIGILYLENKLLTNVFTRERVKLLDLLSSQAAISLENARLYDGMKALNADLEQKIVELERAEEAVRASESKLKQLLEAVPAGVFVIDASGKPYYANQTAQKLLGQGLVTQADPDQLTKIYQAYIEGTDQEYPIDQTPLARALNGESSTIDNMEVHRSDRIIPLEVWATPIFDENGKIVYAIAAFQDITQRKVMEKVLTDYSRTLEQEVAQRTQELQRSKAELEKANESLKELDLMKNEFISTVSHELRTPLTSIRGALGLIAGGVAGEIPPQVKTLIDIANNNSERLVRLINDILDIEKIESGRMDFHIKSIELLPLIEQTIKANKAYGERFGVKFVLKPSLDSLDNPNVKVKADSDRLMQVVTNLLSNAAKFSPPNDTVVVSVSHHDKDKDKDKAKMIKVSVTDHGPGIPDEFRDRVFQKFAQADSSDNRQKGGTGLGLSICKAIIEKLGGKIGFETEMNAGTTFYFDLPEWQEDR